MAEEEPPPAAGMADQRHSLGADAARPPEEMSPCLRCGWMLPARLMGCHGGRCPNCGHIYPHGDCSD